MIALNPKRLPKAVFVSTAIWIHLLSVSARSRSLWQVRMVTATSSFIHSVRSIRSARYCLPCSSVISSSPLQFSGSSFLLSSFSSISPISTLVR
uniref:Putative secreted protein n=1 Tax=Anopheles marajoara TaxID=58244 RepID=A0A2M4C9S2_9DIPT